MQFALDARRLDQLLATRGKMNRELMVSLQSLRAHPFAAWLLEQRSDGRKSGKASPWQRVEWSGYLACIAGIHDPGMQSFMEQSFSTGLLRILKGGNGIFLDEFSALGCLLRGPVAPLMRMGILIRGQLWDWYQDAVNTGQEEMEQGSHIPPVSMCMVTVERWYLTQRRHEGYEERIVAFSTGLAQVAAGVSQDFGLGQLIADREHREGLHPLGKVCLEYVNVGTDRQVRMLYNGGFVMTTPALTALVLSLRHKADLREYHVPAVSAVKALRGYRLPAGYFDLLVINAKGGKEPPVFIVRIGDVCLGSIDTGI